MRELETISPHDFRTLGDYALVERLLKQPRYKIPEHLRDKFISQIEETLDNGDNSDKLKLKAISVACQLDKHNIDLVKMSIPKKTEILDPKKMDDEKLLETVQEVLKLLPTPISVQ